MGGVPGGWGGLKPFVSMGLTVRWRNMAALLKEAWPIGLAVGGVVLAFALALTVGCFLSTTLSAVVRYTGMILQISGLLTVAIGLSKMRRYFGRPSLIDKVSGWFGRLAAAFTAPKPISLEVSVANEIDVAGEVVSAVRALGPGASLDDRVALLEENVNQLRRELDTKVQRLRRGLATVKESIQRESAERQAAHNETTRTIEEVTVGGLHLEMVGLCWLFLGIMGTSMPDGIAALLSLA